MAKKPNIKEEGTLKEGVANVDRREQGSTRKPKSGKQYRGNDKKNPAAESSGKKFYNNLAWYNKNPELLRSAASLPFALQPGRVVTLGSIGDSTLRFKYPGICVIRFIPGCGASYDVTSPVSIAAKEIYSKVRSKFSGSLDADAPDIMMYLLALDSVYSYIAQLKRIYRCISAYSPENLYFPKALVQALTGLGNTGFETLVAQKVQFFGYITELVGMTRKFIFPDVFPLFDRHFFMNNDVYLDAPSIKGQIYVFRQTGFWQIKEDSATGSELEYATITLNGNDPAGSYFNFGRQLISKLSDWDESYTISGYLMRAYEGAKMVAVTAPEVGEIITPRYEEGFMPQLENLKTICGKFEDGSLRIYQDPITNAVLFKPAVVADGTSQYYSAPADIASVKNLMSLRNVNPAYEEITEASRLMIAYHDKPTSSGALQVICATEIPVSVAYYELSSDGGINTPGSPEALQSYIQFDMTDNQSARAETLYAAYQSAFDWHPILPVIEKINAAGAHDIKFYGDLSNVSFVDDIALENLHRVCAYSLFDVFQA